MNFKDACFARGLLEDDGEWKKCLEEAGNMQTGHQLHCLFAILLLSCHPVQPHTLWDLNKEKLCDDLHHRLIAIGHLDPTEEDVFDYGLHLLQVILIKAEKSLSDYPNMPLPQNEWDHLNPNPLLNEQLAYDPEEMSNNVARDYPNFNPEQKHAFDRVMDSVDNAKGKLFFLHSAGGGGKTHVSNTLAAAVRAKGDVALCVASSGIATFLLQNSHPHQ